MTQQERLATRSFANKTGCLLNILDSHGKTIISQFTFEVNNLTIFLYIKPQFFNSLFCVNYVALALKGIKKFGRHGKIYDKKCIFKFICKGK